MATKDPPDPSQYVLDFSSRRADEYRQLRAALQQLPRPDLRMWIMLYTVNNYETADRGWVQSFDELADEFFCNRKTMMRCVDELVRGGLLIVWRLQDERSGAMGKNEYRIDWDGVKRHNETAIRNLGASLRRSKKGDQTQSHGDTTQSLFDPTPSHGDPTQGQKRTSYKEYIPSGDSCFIQEPDPDRRAGSGPGECFESKGKAAGQRIGPAGAELRIALFAEVPELAEARSKLLAPLPAGDLAYGVFHEKSLSRELLKFPASIVTWHQQQLSTLRPVAGDTEADLLLTLAARMRAVELPEREVKRNRVAVFIDAVSRGRWQHVLRYVPGCASWLDAYAEHLGGRMWLAHVQQLAPAITEENF